MAKIIPIPIVAMSASANSKLEPSDAFMVTWMMFAALLQEKYWPSEQLDFGHLAAAVGLPLEVVSLIAGAMEKSVVEEGGPIGRPWPKVLLKTALKAFPEHRAVLVDRRTN